MSKTIKRIDSSLSMRERAAMRASRLSGKRTRARLVEHEMDEHMKAVLRTRGTVNHQENGNENAE